MSKTHPRSKHKQRSKSAATPSLPATGHPAMGLDQTPAPKGQTWLPLLFVLGGFITAFYGFCGVPGLRLYVPHPPTAFPNQYLPFMFGGSALMALGFILGRKALPVKDINRWTAWGFLTLILAVAAYLRLKQYTLPPPLYWMDYALSLIEGRKALEFPNDRHMIFPTGSRQPFYQYVMAAAYGIFPRTPSVILQNMVWAGLDLAALYVHYLLGREIGGRRVGLMTAALYAVAKPVLVNGMTGQCTITTPLSAGLILLTTFRFIRNTDLKHALLWGTALAFGAYCYTPVRIYIWFGPMAALSAVAWRNRKDRKAWFWFLGVGSAALWTYLFVLTNQFMKPLQESLHLPGGALLPWAVLVAFLCLIPVAWSRTRSNPELRTLPVTLVGMAWAGLWSAPMALHPLFSAWSWRWSIFWPGHVLIPEGGPDAAYVFDRFIDAVRALFIGMADRTDMSMQSESFFNFYLAPLMLVGLAWAVSRREPKHLALIACAAVTTIPHVFSVLPHTGRMVGIITPLFILTALGLETFLSFLRNLPAGRAAFLAGASALLIYGGQVFKEMDHRFYTVLPGYASPDVTLFKRALSEGPGRRLYFLEAESGATYYNMSPLVDGWFDLFTRPEGGSTEIPALPAAPTPDVSVYFSSTKKHLRDRILREFPHAQIESIHLPSNPSNQPDGFLFRADIPGKDIPPASTGNTAFFLRRDIPEKSWSRKYFINDFGVGHGVIEHQDYTTDLDAPTPDNLMVPPRSLLAEGRIRIPRDGRYLFSVSSYNYARLFLNKKKILDLRPYGTIRPVLARSVFLKAGDYNVEYFSFFQAGFVLPPITVRFPGETQERPLGFLTI